MKDINIEDFEINQELIDSDGTVCKTKNKDFITSDGKLQKIKNTSYDGTVSKITNKTSNTIEVLINRKSYVVKVDYKYTIITDDGDLNKVTKIEEIQSKGVNHKQWFTMDIFNKRFKKLENKD